MDWCTHCPNGVTPDHRCDAKAALIGEAWGRYEAEAGGKPFVGPAGHLLEQLWYGCGLRRADFYITNVVDRRPTANKIATVGKAELADWEDKLKGRLANLLDPWLIVPTGNTALHALFNQPMKIGQWRGSILAYHDALGRAIKTIPTFHPASAFRRPILQKFMKADWRRIADDRKFRDLRLPKYHHILDPDLEEYTRFYSQLSGYDWPCMSVDVENSISTNELLCVGFSFDGNRSLTIPLSKYATADTARNWQWVKQLCSHPVPKVLQNGLTDQYKLHFYGVELVNYQWDLLEMDHALDPNDGGDVQKGQEYEAMSDEGVEMEMHSLAILTSLHTRQPYYKWMAKGGEEGWNWEQYMIYNGLDCCVTREIQPILKAKLIEAGLL